VLGYLVRQSASLSLPSVLLEIEQVMSPVTLVHKHNQTAHSLMGVNYYINQDINSWFNFNLVDNPKLQADDSNQNLVDY